MRIGEGLAASGRARRASRCARALATLDVFAHFCRATGIDEVERSRPARSATPSNSDDFLLARGARLPVRVLSREEEAHFGYLAAVNSTTLSDGCVLDLGGGSLQLVARRSAGWRARSGRGSWARCG